MCERGDLGRRGTPRRWYRDRINDLLLNLMKIGLAFSRNYIGSHLGTTPSLALGGKSPIQSDQLFPLFPLEMCGVADWEAIPGETRGIKRWVQLCGLSHRANTTTFHPPNASTRGRFTGVRNLDSESSASKPVGTSRNVPDASALTAWLVRSGKQNTTEAVAPELRKPIVYFGFLNLPFALGEIPFPGKELCALQRTAQWFCQTLPKLVP